VGQNGCQPFLQADYKSAIACVGGSFFYSYILPMRDKNQITRLGKGGRKR